MAYQGRNSQTRIVKLLLLISIIPLLFIPYQSYGRIQAIKINEVELNPQGPIANNQWIEIYNMSEDIINISGWKVKSTALGKTYTIPPGFVIRPNDYLVIPFNSIMLGQNNESIVLLTVDSVEVDRTPLLSDTLDDDRTWQRFPNGADTNTEVDWIFTNSTHGRTNGFPIVKEKFRVSQPRFIDTQGYDVQSLAVGKMVGIRSEIVNEFPEERIFVYIIKITDENGITRFISWIEDLVVPQNRNIAPTIFWKVPTKGNFHVETFLWRSFAIPEPLTPQQSGILRVAG